MPAPLDSGSEMLVLLAADPGISDMVESLVERRYSMPPDDFRQMLLLLAATAAVVGGRISIKELIDNVTKK